VSCVAATETPSPCGLGGSEHNSPAMHDPDTTRQNDGCGLEGRDSASEKRSVRGGLAGRKDYARDKLTNGSKMPSRKPR
jgi:hypothetical protein